MVVNTVVAEPAPKARTQRQSYFYTQRDANLKPLAPRRPDWNVNYRNANCGAPRSACPCFLGETPREAVRLLLCVAEATPRRLPTTAGNNALRVKFGNNFDLW